MTRLVLEQDVWSRVFDGVQALAAIAVVVSIYFAYRAAEAARSTVEEQKLLRQEDLRERRTELLNHLAERVAELWEATVRVQRGEGAIPPQMMDIKRGHVTAAYAMTGMHFPSLNGLTTASGPDETASLCSKALTEIASWTSAEEESRLRGHAED